MSSGARGNIAQARQALGLTFTYIEAFEDEAQKMIAQEMTDAQFGQIVGTLWVSESDSKRSQTITTHRSEALRDLFEASPTNANIRGTRWAGYQAITEYLDHYAPVADKADTRTARAERVAVGGNVTQLKTRAFDLISAL